MQRSAPSQEAALIIDARGSNCVEHFCFADMSRKPKEELSCWIPARTQPDLYRHRCQVGQVREHRYVHQGEIEIEKQKFMEALDKEKSLAPEDPVETPEAGDE